MPEAHVFTAAGKSDEQKRNMMIDITKRLGAQPGLCAYSVTVQIMEAKWSEKMTGGRTFEERRAGKTPSDHGTSLA
ncbi:hypothetical protein ACQEVF_52895 [Nonomuraea polychroma]|uniref:hypothetical protein n=1 Tax=Nonomuraea polychroma TaxID=46176 RepID=UPI003D8F66A6